MINYGFVKELEMSFDEAVAAVTEALKKEGFGVLTTIDMGAKFKEKLNVDFGKYVILGACSPANALKAVTAEENIGLLLPCNVIVYDKGGRTAVGIVRPAVAMAMVDNPELKPLAQEVESKLKKVFDSLS
ncbi:MAG: DUF302 domain-containing protein [Elusimicrobiales bacterium]|nr:DUF302 domain-containing protein [Elusimicrobiales bacterium]